MNLFDADILFHVVFGVSGYNKKGVDRNTSRRGILSASKMLKQLKRLAAVKVVFIGVSTGMAFCGVLGHTVRKQYMIVGAPVDMAASLMLISFDKISCDYETVSLSSLSMDKFRSRGMKNLAKIGKTQVYELLFIDAKTESPSNLDCSYPIVGRGKELDFFKDVLDDIGVARRNYSGMLIEGPERSGKSRLLDAFVAVVRNRQIKLLQLSLHQCLVEKAYAVLYHLFLQILDAVDCSTMHDRHNVILDKLADVLAPEDFCYLNAIMRVQFPLTREYCEDTEWRRNTRMIRIFEAILSKVAGCVCILLDNVQHLDPLSWQFLSSALSNKNVVLVVTMLTPASWDDLTQVEVGISQDKRLAHISLEGLGSEYLGVFACQFLNVIAIPASLETILQRRGKNSISWCESFLMSALQIHALNFVTMSPKDVPLYDLVFPDSSYLVKISPELTPEELPPPLHWKRRNHLNVCVPSGTPIGFVETNRDHTGLRIDIYNRMNSYEQDFVKCAAALGQVFQRRMVESMMTNSTPLYTATAVGEMIRLRILECAMVQRKHFHSDDSAYSVMKKRRTFSNMHHLVTCACEPTRIFAASTLPSQGHCKLLEFTIPSYRKLFYDILPPHEKKDYHSKAASLYGRQARRCNTCGNGSFFTLFAKEEAPPEEPSVTGPASMTAERNAFTSRGDRREPRRSIFAIDNSGLQRRRESISIRRISILPVHVDNDEEEVPEPAATPEAPVDLSWEGQLKRFTHIDYSNCRCIYIIDYVFWQLHYHLVNSNDYEKLPWFMMEYTAGLMATGQPLYATKFLMATTISWEVAKLKEQLFEESHESVSNKGKTLILMGDAFAACGGYPLAKKFYREAVALRTIVLQTYRAVCYYAVLERLRHFLLGFPDYTLNRVSGEAADGRLQLAVALQRLSTILKVQDLVKASRLATLQSLRTAFETEGGFAEKTMIYLTAVKTFRDIGDLGLVRPLEKPMARTIDDKTTWYQPGELVLLAKVYQTMFETRVLHGEYDDSIEIGSKVLKICDSLHIFGPKIDILPSLIEVMVWTKRLNQAMDLMKTLYFVADEDVDQSAITWYYALSLEFLLDAGIILESYDTCHEFYHKISVCRSKARVSRDPASLSRLTTCLAIWQLRTSVTLTDDLVQDVNEYVKDLRRDNFPQIYNSVKGLECYLLVLKRRINIKKSTDLFERMENANTILKSLRKVYDCALFVVPFFFVLQAYMNLLRGRRFACQQNLQRAEGWSLSQGNNMVLAWIEQYRRTWKKSGYNTMGQYWVEHVSAADAVRWQDIESFSQDTWSTILYPLPVPDSNF
ncbi:adenylate cyclase type 10 [Andrena cerasifolii]|uniref:adenylate cyclase type 10 n=1 Tax=Andrena cerasifolii TaxID=2819439 RepID=UPI004037784A